MHEVKIFLWHACSEALPRKSNLLPKKILDDPTCSQCCTGPENTLHSEIFGWIKKDFSAITSFADLVSLVGDHVRQLDLFATVAWSIWCRRNKLRCNKPSLPLGKILESTGSLLSEFQKHNRSSARGTKQRSIKWKPPAAAMLKTNFDGAMFVDSDQSGIVAVIRNESGLVMAALSDQGKRGRSCGTPAAGLAWHKSFI